MMQSRILLVPLVGLSFAAISLGPACSSSDDAAPPATSSTTGVGGMGGMGGGLPDPTLLCDQLSLPKRAFSEGPYGTHRGDIADDFTVDLLDGTQWNLRERFSGCESYVFVPDRLPVSDLDDTSVWESEQDLRALLMDSPRNVHWFFVSRWTDAQAEPSLQGMQARIDAVLSSMDPADAEHWKARAHVLATKASELGGWLQGVLTTHGRIGFGIDRMQRIRGAGYLADVTRYKSSLDAAGVWPWESNLAYAAHEPRYYNAEAAIYERLDSETATVVTLFDGEILQEFQDVDVMLPSAAEMAGFDSFEVEVTMQCPDPDEIELGNCGAWDYLANLYVEDANMNLIELGRFITTYHREAHWVLDATPMLVHLRGGGLRKFRWSFAPSWNTQPTATRLSLRFSNKGKGVTPAEATFLWSGGPFDSAYNTVHLPMDVPISATAKRVELWSLVTGHGADTNYCAEFCNHEHEITVNGKSYIKDHPQAATNEGCIAELEHGMTPNQAGTWWFGRGGWCPGQQVAPWIVDVTADVVLGQTATVSYRGLLGGVDPPDNAGNIQLTSYLVVYE